MPVNVFLSYRNLERSNAVAAQLQTMLETQGYRVFYDKDRKNGLLSGEQWAQKIYDSIHACDVLIILMQNETAESEWVQREVDTARGAYVSILPLAVVEANDLDWQHVAAKLALNATQYDQFSHTPEFLNQLTGDIERLAASTQNAQYAWFDRLRQQRKPQPAANNQQYATFISRRGGAHPAQIHLLTGDMLAIKNVDVLVNSENDYMQMARVFESNTISSRLRYEGAERNKAGQMVADTLQAELNDQLEGVIRPVALTTVFATHAGHPTSRLRKQTGVRYIFHVATMRLSHLESAKKAEPLSDDHALRMCISNCFEKLNEINEQGDIWPVEEGERQPPVRSIAFPLFGTGMGGRSAHEVAPSVIRAIDECLSQPCGSLESVYLCVYVQRDVEMVEKAMSTVFNRV